MASFSAFDSRGYRTVAPREGYDRWAATYEETVEDAMDVALLERLGTDWGAVGSVADLGCGTGRTGAWLGARDAAVSCLVDEHLADLGPLYAEAARLLAPGGRFVIVGFHPHFIIASGMPTHFDDAESGEPVAIETHVHMLSEHVAAGTGAGLTLAELHERVVDDEWVALKLKWERFRDHPISFAFVWVARG